MKKILLIFILPLVVFWPSLFVFFTNDDFYFLRISEKISLVKFISFFNIFAKNPDGFGVYRPLTTQVFYIIKNPFVMHLIVFLTFFAILYAIYKLGLVLFENEKVAITSTFLYSVSSTHFAHFYYLATYQELGATLFVLLMLLSFFKKKGVLSHIFFLLALMSKETALVAPLLLLLCDWHKNGKINFSRYLGYLLITLSYLFSHFYYYGIATGDSYIWDFSLSKIANTIFWYVLWSLNLPETLIDFIGPGLRVKPNLFIYWSSVIYPIFGLFIVELVLIAYLMIRKLIDLENKRNSLFVMVWFFVCLLPVMFLPYHKFSFYLTLPLVGIVYRIAYLLVKNKVKTIFIAPFLIIWTLLSILTIKHSINTSWITNGEKIANRVYIFFKSNKVDGKNFYFGDSPNDASLPWSPTQVVKTALSGKNFFYVCYPGLVDKVSYSKGTGTQINSRQFLGY